MTAVKRDSQRQDTVGPNYSIRAVERVCDILDLIQRSGRHASLAEVASVTGLPRSSAFRYLATLEGRGYVERDAGSHEYRLGMALVPAPAHRQERLRELALPHLERLRDRFDETVNLGALDRGRVRYLAIVESRRGVRLAARPGGRDPVHSTSLGKAIAATLPRARVEAILTAEGMPALTPSTITSGERFLAELEQVRERGFAVDDRENEPDGRCVAVAIPGEGLSGGISLSAPASRFPLERAAEIAAALHAAAGAIAGEIGAAASRR